MQTSKAKYNISKLFENDTEIKSNPALQELVSGKKFSTWQKSKKNDMYDDELVYSRFLNLRR